MRLPRDRRDRVEVLTFPLLAGTVALWTVLGYSLVGPLKEYNRDMFISIGGLLVIVVLLLCAYYGHGDEWD